MLKQFSIIWKRFLKHRLGTIGLMWLFLVVFAALGSNLISRWPYYEMNLQDRYSPPSSTHWLGTDAIGRDVWSRVITGARASLVVATIGVTGSMIIGMAVGAASAMLSNIIDVLLQRLTEIVMSLPLLIITLVFMTFVKPGIWPLILVLVLFGWADTSRVVRGELLSIREEQYIEAARAFGASTTRIILKHALPGCLSVILVNSTLKAATFILVEASMSFLGYGVQPPTPSWGLMLANAQEAEVLTHMPWLWVPPGIAIVFTVLSLNFVGDGLRDALSPREEYPVV